MSLKNIIRKSVASLGALALLSSHCSLCGIGLIEVIAENQSVPQIGIEWSNEKYVQYLYTDVVEVEGQQVEKETKGVAVQSKLSVYPIYGQDTYLPTEKVEISVGLPSINGYLPEKTIVAEASTKSTTGKENDTSVNQNYDSNSGLLTVSYENTPDENQNIYMAYSENAKDEFEIIYIYPAEAYSGNDEEIKMQSFTNARMTLKTENGSMTSENVQTFEITEKNNKGDILTFGVTGLKNNIYKGFMYSNVQNKTSYDTKYNTVSTFAVLNANVVDTVSMELKEPEFILNNEEQTRISTNGNVVYKSTQISRAEFDKIVGQNEALEIYTGTTQLATVKYIEVSENEQIVKKLAVIYANGEMEILSNEDAIILVEYAQNVSSLKINITKPVAEGFMYIENKNLIKAVSDYGCDVEDIKYIATEGVVNGNTSSVKMQLLEPETKISVVSSNTNFSTLQNNKTTLTITLDDTNSSAKLFNDPIIKVKLPDGIVAGNLSSPEIVNGNGLSIKNTTSNNNVITIELEGKQTTYDLTNVSGGVKIVMDIENIDYADTLPTHADKIEVTCIQGKEEKVANCNVNIVSKEGLLMLTKVSNYDKNGSVLSTLDSDNISIHVEEAQDAKQINQEIIFVNNYDKELTDVEIIGKLGVTDSTFKVDLAKAIETNKTEVKIYYSEDNNSWTEEYTNLARLYKVVLTNNELKSKESLVIKLSLGIPGELPYNQVSNVENQISYGYEGQNRTEKNTIQIQTSKVEEFVANLYSNVSDISVGIVTTAGGQEVNPGDEVHEGQVLKSKVTLVNNKSEEVIYKVKTTIENAVYYELISTGQIYNPAGDPDTRYGEAEIGDVNREYEVKIPAVSSIELEYQYVVSKDVDNVANKINVLDENNNNIIDEIKLENKVKDSKMKLLIEYAYNEQVTVFSNLNAVLKIKNYESKDLKDIIIKMNLPKELMVNEFEYYGEQNVQLLNGSEQNVLEVNIDKIPANETIEILIFFNVDLDVNLKEKIVSLNATCDYNNETYLSNDLSKKVYQSKTNLNMDVNCNVEGGTVKAGEKVKYTVNISNSGSLDLNDSMMKFTPSTGMNVDSAQIIYADGTIEKIDIESNSNVNKSLNIKNVDNIIIEYNITVEYTLEEMTSTFYLTDTYFNSISKEEKLTGIIEQDEELEEFDPEDEVPKENTEMEIPDDIFEEEPEEMPEEIPEDKPWEAPNKPGEDPDEPGEAPDKPGEDPEEPGEDPEEPGEAPDEPGEAPDEPGEGPEEPIEKYAISGVAWLDINKDGERNTSEIVLENINVTLIDMNTGKIATDSDGNNINAMTDSNGKYVFSNLLKGNYSVLFEFDTTKYTVTTYQKEGINEELNSDAILSQVTINSENKKAGLTDKISLELDKNNVDIGLIENATFDLCLDKKITKITVIDSQGTKTYEYAEGHTAKVDLVAKYMSGANVIVNYKFTVTNNGDVTGYVNSLKDSLPSGLEFSSELNNNWYKGNDGQLYTTSLSSKAIKPGESIEVDLILTKTMTTENAGTFVNSASLEKISNLENIEEKQETIENNESSAILIISIKTGSIIMYIGITTLCIAIIGVGCYLINKKVLRRTM